ncbi:uncharacterized protein [Rutidosis leptorrhynchoides]|uniref:uncharacterized protein n=1 Tax=Rutidosis leptorrhynchoides TaxID=125765 RepID=UPI003A99B86E
MRTQIKSFKQLPGELFHEAYERLKELLRACPHHEIPKWELVKAFYDSLDSQNRQYLLAASGGAFLTRSSDDEWMFFEQLSKGSKTQASGLACNVSEVQEVCEICGDPSHFSYGCRNGIPPVNHHIVAEHVNEVQGRRFDPYSNTYNSGWRNHPNFSWSNNNALNANQGNQQRPQNNFQNQVEVQNKSIGALAKEIGNVAESKGNREPGTIPSYTVLNPNHKDSGKGHSVNMVGTLRSGKKYDNKVGEKEVAQRDASKSPIVLDEEDERKLNASLPKKVKLIEKVSAVISGSLPPKFKDPGTPLISVTVGNVNVKKALLDLGASINILPSSLVDQYELGTLKYTDILVQLADRSMRTPRGCWKM